jgi:hypothetical protein
MLPNFNWKRFWVPRGSIIDLSDSGYFYDPESEWGRFHNPKAVSLDHLADRPFLALLGEPGMGKTGTLKREIEGVSAKIAERGDRVLILDLRSFGSEERLINALFHSDEFTEWKKGDGVLHLFLDSLDECLLRIDNVGSLLVDELSKLPISRLRVRIACRTARWPSVLESGALELYGKDGFDAHELAPLRKADVFLAAKESGSLDPALFLAGIAKFNAMPLAIKPVTLKFLLTMYLRNGVLANDQLQLYEEGCRILLEEVNENRRSAGQFGTVTTEQRFAIAMRIAAVTQFTNRFAIWTGTQAEGAPEEDVTLEQLSGGSELETQVTNANIREVLDTGLFSSRGSHRVGWAHQTYAEYLAAKFIQKKELPVVQVKPLLFYTGSVPQRLVPQLSEVAAWMASLDSSIFREVATSDPEALLAAAAAGLSFDHKRELISALLKVCEDGRLLNFRWDLFRYYDKLKHPEIADQLRPYLVDKHKAEAARDLTVDIARACEVNELMPALGDIALDPTERRGLRILGAAAVAYSSSEEQKIHLRSLLSEEDPDDELKGLTLRALWPDLMEDKELFSLISSPKRRNLSGAYSSFLYDLSKELSPSSLKAGLAWFARQAHRNAIAGPIELLMDAVIKVSWDHLQKEDIAQEFVEAMLSRLKLHDDLVSSSDRDAFYTNVAKDETKRRFVLERFLPKIEPEETNRIVYFGRGFVVSLDQPWLIERILTDISPQSKAVEVKLVWYLTDIKDTNAVSRLWSACQHDGVLNAECAKIFYPIALDAPEVPYLRKDQRDRQLSAPELLDPPPSVRVECDLIASETGNLAAWLDLSARDLLLELNGPEIGHRSGPTDLSTTPGWQSANEATRLRILESAFRYIQQADPKNEEWTVTSNRTFGAIACYQALVFLLREKPELLNAIESEVWKKWIPIILRQRFGDRPELDAQACLVKMSYSQAPVEFIRVLIQTVENENAIHGHLFVLRGLDQCWDADIGTALLDNAKVGGLKPEILGTLLCKLLEHEVPGAEEFAKSLITLPPNDETELLRTEKAAEAIISCGLGAGWSYLKPILEQYPAFGRKVVESVSYQGGGFPRFLRRLSEPELADFYIWMAKQYPYRQDDEDANVGGAMSSVDTVEMLRGHTLEHLKKRATFAAVEGFHSIIRALPGLHWLRYHLDETETLARASAWIPLKSAEFIELTKDRKNRIVSTGRELLDVITESLARFEATLHGELTPVRNLWNHTGGKWSPQDEEHLSDNIALHLENDLRKHGIIVNREVQIRRPRGKDAPGQSTDIHVDTIVSPGAASAADHISVIIEVKGNWNKEIETAMKNQLRDRYLKDNQSRYGLYVIGWFSCEQWDRTDYRSSDCPSFTLDEARHRFEKQASNLSVEGYELRAYILDVRLSR